METFFNSPLNMNDAIVDINCNYENWDIARRTEDPIYFCAEMRNSEDFGEETNNVGFVCFSLNADEAIKIADALYECVKNLKNVESED